MGERAVYALHVWEVHGRCSLLLCGVGAHIYIELRGAYPLPCRWGARYLVAYLSVCIVMFWNSYFQMIWFEIPKWNLLWYRKLDMYFKWFEISFLLCSLTHEVTRCLGFLQNVVLMIQQVKVLSLVFLNQDDTAPLGDIWQCLGTFFNDHDWGAGCSWHLRPEMLLNISQCPGQLPQTGIIWSKVSTVLRFRNLGLE